MASVDSTIQLIHIREQGADADGTGGGTCTPELALAPWAFDTGAPMYGPGASMDDIAPASTPRQPGLPQEYRQATAAELDLRIRAAKHTLGDRLLMMGSLLPAG